MNRITMMCKEEDAKTTTTRVTEEDLNIYFVGRCFYEFVKGLGFDEETIKEILISEGLYDM
jgi:hypothetical protein